MATEPDSVEVYVRDSMVVMECSSTNELTDLDIYLTVDQAHKLIDDINAAIRALL